MCGCQFLQAPVPPDSDGVENQGGRDRDHGDENDWAHDRKVVWRQESWIPVSEHLKLEESEAIETKKIRFRTLGDITITGGIESDADSLEKIVAEVSAMKQTERGNRSDDKRSETAMEDRKRQGYF